MPLDSHLSLSSSPRSAAEARRWVRGAFAQLRRPELTQAAEVGVSELVANAVLHGEEPILVRLRGTTMHPRVEVFDGSPEPPVPPDLTTSEDGVLSTVGRGMTMVARSALAWGATIERRGKTVWFEPASELREDGDIDWVIDQFFDEVLDEPSEDLVDIVLLGFDLHLNASLRRHYRELRRELRLLTLAHQEEYPLASDLSAMFATFERQFPRSYFDQVDAAEKAGLHTVDIRAAIMPASAPIFVTMSEMFDLADSFCRAERLLAIERTAEQRAFHSWLLGELVAQATGHSATPWPGSSPVRSSHVS